MTQFVPAPPGPLVLEFTQREMVIIRRALFEADNGHPALKAWDQAIKAATSEQPGLTNEPGSTIRRRRPRIGEAVG